MLLEHTGGSVAEYAAVHAAGGSIQPALEQQERRGLAEDFVRDKSALKTTRILRQPVQKGTDAGSRRRIKPSAAHESTGEAVPQGGDGPFSIGQSERLLFEGPTAAGGMNSHCTTMPGQPLTAAVTAAMGAAPGTCSSVPAKNRLSP